MRFLVQWIASERAGKSVMPIAFWIFSIGGGLMTAGLRAIVKRDPVFIFGQALASFIYVRNIMLIFRSRRDAAQRDRDMRADLSRVAASAAKPRSRSAIRSSTSSRPMWKRTVGPPGAQAVAVRIGAQSNGIARLS